jgi:hypothetical protein
MIVFETKPYGVTIDENSWMYTRMRDPAIMYPRASWSAGDGGAYDNRDSSGLGALWHDPVYSSQDFEPIEMYFESTEYQNTHNVPNIYAIGSNNTCLPVKTGN